MKGKKWRMSGSLKILLCIFWLFAIILPLVRMLFSVISDTPTPDIVSAREVIVCSTRSVFFGRQLYFVNSRSIICPMF